MDKKILILATALLATTAGRAQHLSGTVTDASTRQPVQGVAVQAGRSQALTDTQGHYSLKNTTRHGTVSFSKNGYVTTTLSLRGDTLLDACIYNKAFRDKVSAETFTRAVDDLSADDVLSQLSGADVRGVTRSANGAVGSNLFIRGLNTLNSNTQPLLVVDGTVWDEQTAVNPLFQGFTQNTIADIDVNDIETLQVLKDATAIYGSKGANGAIIITTRRSHSTVTRIAADISYSFNFKPKTYDMMNAADYRAYLSEQVKGSSLQNTYATTFKGMFGTDRAAADYNTFHNDIDWSDEVYRMGGTQHYGINVDGSDDVAKYNISLGYTKNNATVESTDFSRLNARINADISLSRSLDVATRLYYTYTERNLQDDGVNAYTSPTFLADIKSPFLLPYAYTDDGSQLTHTLNGVDVLGVSNPVALIDNAKNTNKHYRVGLALAPTWVIGRGFSAQGRFSYTHVSTREHYFSPMTGIAPQTVDGHRWENTVKDQSYTQNSIYADAAANYAQTFGYHDLKVQVGLRYMMSDFDWSYADGHNTGNDNVSNLNNSLSYRTLNGDKTDWKTLSLFGRAAYTYDHRYTLEATLVSDRSSRFDAWATFPELTARWNMGNEAFLAGSRWLSAAELHATWGASGNDDIDGIRRYSYLQGVNYMGTATGLRLGALANKDLKWERTEKLSVGFSLGFLKDRLSLAADFYKYTTKDLLILKQAELATGKDTYPANGGKLQNTGVEFTLAGKPLVLRHFSWTSSLSLAHYKNEVKALADGDYTTTVLGGEVLTAVGAPLARFYGYKTAGIFSTAEEAAAANLKVQNSDASYSTFGAGDVHFVDRDGNGIIKENDRQVIGDPNPDFTGTFFNRFAWKRLSLEVLCTFSSGNDVYNYPRQMLESMSTLHNQTNAVRNRCKNEGQVATMPRASYGDPMGNSRFSDRWIEDGSFFKVKNVKLSYDIPINNTYIHGLQVWTAGANLLTLTKYLGIDPEVSMSSSSLWQGIDNGYLAYGRSFYMGVKINL